MSAQQDFFDASMRHAIGVRNLSGGETKRILALLDQADKELQAKLAKRLSRNMSFKTKRWRKLLVDIRQLRREVFKEIVASNRREMIALAHAEQEFAIATLDAHVPVRLDYATVSAEQLRAVVTAEPFAGGTNAARTLSQWWAGTRQADATRIIDALRLGMAQAETVPQMTSRVRSATKLTRHQAEAVVRTGVNHVTNSARGKVFEANSDIVSAERWTAMLDGRTTAVCRGRDGHFAPVGGSTGPVPMPHLQPPTARPPAHPSCRSQMTGHLSSDGIAAAMPTRPFVRDTRTRKWREKDFRADARASAGNRWKGMNRTQRNNAVKRQRQQWTERNVGTATVGSYDGWLRTQPVKFQNDVLGVAKAKAFRKGLKLDKFIDRRGAELTLPQLKDKFPSYL